MSSRALSFPVLEIFLWTTIERRESGYEISFRQTTGRIVAFSDKNFIAFFFFLLLLLSGDARPNILAAIKDLQEVSCVRFKDKDDGDKHWIRFVKKEG